MWMKNPVHRFPSSMLILNKRRTYALVLSISCTATPHRAHQGHLTSNRRTEPLVKPHLSHSLLSFISVLYFLLPQYSWVWKNKRRCKMLCLSIDERMYSQLSNRHGPVPHMPGSGRGLWMVVFHSFVSSLSMYVDVMVRTVAVHPKPSRQLVRTEERYRDGITLRFICG